METEARRQPRLPGRRSPGRSRPRWMSAARARAICRNGGSGGAAVEIDHELPGLGGIFSVAAFYRSLAGNWSR